MTANRLEPLLEVDVHTVPADRRAALEHDVRLGLAATPKQLPPTWFYDERGSELFEQITNLPEYYPTRVERSILASHAREIIEVAKCDTLVELGSGSSEKTRILLDAMAEAQTLARFVPFDVSESILRSAAAEINREYAIPVTAVVGDFHRHLLIVVHVHNHSQLRVKPNVAGNFSLFDFNHRAGRIGNAFR